MVTSGFFNSSNGDRKYTAEQMSSIFDFLIKPGVLETYGNKFFTTPSTSGLGVVLGSGWAWFDQTWTMNDGNIPFVLDEPDPSLARIDTIALVVNKSQLTRANTFQVFKGLPSLSPTPAPINNTSTIIAHPLAYVTVPADASTISASNIEILVGKSTCPFITSILQTTDITTLFQGWTEQYNLAYSGWNTDFHTSLTAWEAEFNEWFEHLQTYLSEDVVTNLQLQINQLKKADTDNMTAVNNSLALKVNTADKATTTNAQSGTDDTKWMTPLKVNEHFAYRAASDSEVANGSSVTKFVKPNQLKTYGSIFGRTITAIKSPYAYFRSMVMSNPIGSLILSDGTLYIIGSIGDTIHIGNYTSQNRTLLKIPKNGSPTQVTMTASGYNSTSMYNGILSPNGRYIANTALSQTSYICYTSNGSVYRSFSVPSVTKHISIFTPSKLIIGITYVSSTSLRFHYLNYLSSASVLTADVSITDGSAGTWSSTSQNANRPIAGQTNSEVFCIPSSGSSNKILVINSSSWTHIATHSHTGASGGAVNYLEMIATSNGCIALLCHHSSSNNNSFGLITRVSGSSATKAYQTEVNSGDSYTWQIKRVNYAQAVCDCYSSNNYYHAMVYVDASKVIAPSIGIDRERTFNIMPTTNGCLALSHSKYINYNEYADYVMTMTGSTTISKIIENIYTYPFLDGDTLYFYLSKDYTGRM